ncbi:Glyoxalase/Bleomycin resistance protein/Dioxygenase superfamily protein [Pseudarcicella hirudinis]|uniref:Glyoxalase/Bleomycin resistance protein/Dioxygenase superfamily protein n=1 Tax=Pseudarcicella hirudinis TaxID=1079859 RepID=A0A1I5VZM9_9BACT|nr:VOC family protein [Pseudarcicella hirudinis]SFQ12466.1 Glyoxalase/Bleomycin resistance protein/Dioxygenase superfamily protein [Pseudarcicella hirudinis]
MKIKEINHVALYVRDVGVSMKFYGETLELEQDFRRPAFDFGGAWYKLGSRQSLHLLDGRTDEEISSSSRRNHFAVEVESIKECEAFLRNKGLEFMGPKLRPDGVPQIFLKDPDGYWMEFTEL